MHACLPVCLPGHASVRCPPARRPACLPTDRPHNRHLVHSHSLGGLIAALACLKDQGRWAGMMLCSPALDVQMSLSLRCASVLPFSLEWVVLGEWVGGGRWSEAEGNGHRLLRRGVSSDAEKLSFRPLRTGPPSTHAQHPSSHRHRAVCHRSLPNSTCPTLNIKSASFHPPAASKRPLAVCWLPSFPVPAWLLRLTPRVGGLGGGLGFSPFLLPL